MNLHLPFFGTKINVIFLDMKKKTLYMIISQQRNSVEEVSMCNIQYYTILCAYFSSSAV